MKERIGLWVAFAFVHGILSWLCLNAPGLPLGDVTLVYKPWMDGALTGGQVVGIDGPWVYPILAFVPMALAWFISHSMYGEAWLAMIAVLNAIAFSILIGRGQSRKRLAAAWWWLAFILLLGPIALARVDSVTVPIAVVAVLLLSRRPYLAGVLLAVATWMKIWPVAIIVSVVITSRRRKEIIIAGAITSLAVAACVIGLGGLPYLLSFITQQTGRGLQIEAPISTIYMWQAAMHQPGSFVFYDLGILTFQVTGNEVNTVIALSTPLLVLAIVGVVLLGALAVHRGGSLVRTLPPLMLALVLTLIAFNKVGSPQFMSWLVAPIVFGLVLRGSRWFVPAAIALGLAALTQLVYPYLYNLLLAASPPMVLVLTVRNIGFFVLLGWAIMELWRAHRPETDARDERSALSAGSLA